MTDPAHHPDIWSDTPPGWYTDPHRTEVMLWWDGTRYRDHDQPLPTPDNWIPHFLLFAVALAALYLACALLVGFVILVVALRTTGRRARDILMILIPVWGEIVVIQTVWRLTAFRMCWLPRQDMPSKPLFGPAILPKDIIPHNYRSARGGVGAL